MTLYSRELESFEVFCRNEFQQLFRGNQDSLPGTLSTIYQLQTPFLSRKQGAATVADQVLETNTQFKSIEYSFFSGGKRFRPLLALAMAEYLNMPFEKVFPWAMAIEMIHSYSLIHDDLPSMDNDDFRRGKPTNHKVFGEAVALLSGDGLLTEAFSVLSKHYNNDKDSVADLISCLTHVSGTTGMILGQYLDISIDNKSTPVKSSIEELNKIHLLKTGALISGSFMGPALLKKVSARQKETIQEIGLLLGYAFQVKDDILDNQQDSGSNKNLNYFFNDQNSISQFLDQIHRKIDVKIRTLSEDLKLEAGKNLCLTQFLDWNSGREK